MKEDIDSYEYPVVDATILFLTWMKEDNKNKTNIRNSGTWEQWWSKSIVIELLKAKFRQRYWHVFLEERSSIQQYFWDERFGLSLYSKQQCWSRIHTNLTFYISKCLGSLCVFLEPCFNKCAWSVMKICVYFLELYFCLEWSRIPNLSYQSVQYMSS